MDTKKRNHHAVTAVLFLAYLAFLVWVILFKMGFSLEALRMPRTYNLVPFQHGMEYNAIVSNREIMANFLVFIPMGFYLSLLGRIPALARIYFGACCSFALECAQYILAVGRFDITDLITNTAGCIAGVLACELWQALFRDKEKAERILAVLTDLATAPVVLGIPALAVISL